MSDDMTMADYLAGGGKLTSPANVPPRYRAELMRLMASFVDSEMAGSAGFADVINSGPGIKERIAAARIVLEKLDHAEKVLTIMGDFGADTARYATHHPWTSRLARTADIGASRVAGDMRLSVFHYPLEGWTDAVAMNVLMGRATVLQLQELCGVSYQPLTEAFRAILPVETRHADLGVEGLRKILEDPAAVAPVRAALAYWHPKVAATFGSAQSQRFEALRRLGLRSTPNEILQERWRADVAGILSDLGLPAL
ncbi:Phenylacetic acid catabolic protein [Polymorphum gilvum]|uniref:Phenylacetic acid catabolic family protein n=1 Tax=Polymorphum gilvum (strain LMG 25793 / CGMCC 1.9160 / SL003B-26A1) TaxID=991905 RepID=F2IYW0_POLGS|nr:Phenylacetic acid catabolic protein [Polymorphum gilvum]ADZ70575.1 Phenylacetic acid catabolic family protein [Polymorphum gilvum SL003B-26A1]